MGVAGYVMLRAVCGERQTRCSSCFLLAFMFQKLCCKNISSEEESGSKETGRDHSFK